MCTSYKLVDCKSARALSKYGKMPLWIFGATVAGIAGVDLLTGVILGVFLSFVRLVHTASQIDIRVEEGVRPSRAAMLCNWLRSTTPSWIRSPSPSKPGASSE